MGRLQTHLTETCDGDGPHRLTRVETTAAPAPDLARLAAIQADLARVGLLPAEQLVDGGYVRGRRLAASRHDHQIELVGPIYEDRQWQAKAHEGCDVARVQIDRDANVATCPQGRRSARWRQVQTARGRTMIHAAFAPEDCAPCLVRAHRPRAQGPAPLPDAPAAGGA